MRLFLINVFTFFTVFLFTASNIFAHQYFWNLKENDRLELVKTAKVQFLVNRQLQRSYEERNIIDLTCYQEKEHKCDVKGAFSVFTKDDSETIFKLTDKRLSDFTINKDGSYLVDKKYSMPNLRHIPTFPDKDLKQGDKWSGKGELYIDNFSVVLGLQLNVDYEIVEEKIFDGKNVAVINYKYNIDKNFSANRQQFPDLPSRIVGANDGIVYWDLDKNELLTSFDKYHIVFAFPSNYGKLNTFEFIMNIDTAGTVYSPVPEKQKEVAKEEIEKALPKDSGITVDTNEQGIVLRLGEILFDFDSAALKDNAKNTLDKVNEIIKQKYPDREIIVEGHTDNIGNKNYNKNLSEKRASKVAGYIKDGVGHDKMSYRGFGAEKPIAENNSAEGRQKNRRVEVIIKLK